ANSDRVIARLAHQHRQALYVVERAKVMIDMLVAVLTVLVVEQPGQDDRAAGAAACRGAKGIAKERAGGGQRVEVRSLKHRIAITAGVLPLIVGDEQNDVLFCGYGRL